MSSIRLASSLLASLIVATSAVAQTPPVAASDSARDVAVASAPDTAAPRPAKLPLSIVGTVRDQRSRPLRAAEVRAGGRYAISDNKGQFRIDSVMDDPVFLLVRRIGFQPAESEIARDSDVVQVRLGVQLEPSAVQLGTVIVNERRVSTVLFRSGFLRRQSAGFGTHYDADRLQDFTGTWASLFTSTPGTDVRDGPMGAIIPTGTKSGGLGGMKCPLNIFLDGMFVPWAFETGINGVLPKEELLAIEIYPDMSVVPAQFLKTDGQGPGERCGAVLLWSRPFVPRR